MALARFTIRALICEFVQRASVVDIRSVYKNLFEKTSVAAPLPCDDVSYASKLAEEERRCSAYCMSHIVRDTKLDEWKYWNTPLLFAREHPGFSLVLWELLYFSDLANKYVI